jgi:hypothetical protein
MLTRHPTCPGAGARSFRLCRDLKALTYVSGFSVALLLSRQIGDPKNASVFNDINFVEQHYIGIVHDT